MADIKISDLPAAAAPLGPMQLEVNDAGTSRRISLDQSKAYAQSDLGGLAFKTNVNDGDWSGTDLSVGNGGTGVSTFTDGGVLIGNGTSAVQNTTAGTVGQALLSNGPGNDPTFQDLPTQTAGLVVVSASKTLDITDAGKQQYISASNPPYFITIPLNSSVPFLVGTLIPIIYNNNGAARNNVNTTATIAIIPTSGVTLRGPRAIPGIAKPVALRKIATDTWSVENSLSPPFPFIADRIGQLNSATGTFSITSNIGANPDGLDLGILMVGTNNSPVATPTGWTSLTSIANGTVNSGQSVQIFYATGSAAHSASVVVTNGVSNIKLAIIRGGSFSNSGAFIASSLETPVTGTQASSTTAVSFPNVTTTNNNDLIISVVSHSSVTGTGSSMSTIVLPANTDGYYSLSGGVNNANNPGGGLSYVAYAKNVLGVAATVTAVIGTASTQALASIAIKPGYGI